MQIMKTEPGLSRRQADELLSLIGDDLELRDRMAEVLRSELLGSRGKRVHDVGRLRR
jgi:hypothetical protein